MGIGDLVRIKNTEREQRIGEVLRIDDWDKVTIRVKGTGEIEEYDMCDLEVLS